MENVTREGNTKMLQQQSSRQSRLYRSFTNLRLNDHLCLICESEEEWCRTAASFVVSGLEKGRRCMWISNRHRSGATYECLRGFDVDLSELQRNGCLLILESDDLWGESEEVDFDRAFVLLMEKSEELIDGGRAAFHLIEEMPALQTRASCESLLEYEARLNRDIFARFPCVGLCLYDRWRSSAHAIKNAIMTHPVLMRNGIVYQNFYYVPPEEFLGDRRDEREVQDMLASIEKEGETQNRVRFLSRVLELSSQAFCSTYPDGCVMHCNPAFSRLTGYSERELRAMKWMRDLTPSEWREEQAKVLGRVRRTGAAQLYERELVRKDGSRVPVEVFVHQITNEAGDLEYYYTFINDVSERKGTFWSVLRRHGEVSKGD
jgi:PAS domain S-box-containing protein